MYGIEPLGGTLFLVFTDNAHMIPVSKVGPLIKRFYNGVVKYFKIQVEWFLLSQEVKFQLINPIEKIIVFFSK